MRTSIIILALLASQLCHAQSIAELAREAEIRANPLSAYETVGYFYGGSAWATLRDADSGELRYGVVSEDGTRLVPFEYDDLNQSHDDSSSATIYYGVRGKYCGCIGSDNQVIVPFVYEGIGYWAEGYCKVQRNGKYGIVKHYGSEVVPCRYDDLGHVSDGLVETVRDRRHGVLDLEGKTVVPLDYDEIGGFHNGLLWVNSEKRYGVFTTSGKLVQECAIEKVLDFDTRKEVGVRNMPVFCKETVEKGWYLATINGKCGIINERLQTIVAARYDHITAFSHGLACCLRGKLWGLIDKSGQEVLPCLYTVIGNISKGKAATSESAFVPDLSQLTYVMKDWRWGMIRNGKTVIDAVCDSLGTPSDSMLLAKTDGFYHYYDLEGREPITQRYTYARDFSDGLAAVGDDKGRTLFINKTGTMVIKPKHYDRTDGFHNGACRVYRKDKSWLIDKEGKKLKTQQSSRRPDTDAMYLGI